ncbi:Fe2+-enterobactin ABC transporter substrate-binding protein [Corynebacterium sp. sy039]|uniref:Fe2+-enterobactin ABC transporter substrate-binding protein n=1 Tax=Corynebacterium sp. sy039 TaxID=2599641 RepID=UPI0011B40640|nr:Fe2+-enterobactin ABC transporter substrate-binding protein [Corynebacterium sp. sy039]QDZ42969.1 Fe2+-enterobactin ABC transporter substrate-binding protein [Corynebacterium sp. sy039]
MFSLRTTRRAITSAVAATAVAFSLVSCSNSNDSANSESTAAETTAAAEAESTDEGQWPRTIKSVSPTNPQETIDVTIEKKPENIVSTAVSLTGGLLAIDAPLAGTAVQSKNNGIADDKGFFTQWADVAEEKNLATIYEREPNAEAILAANPDLVIMSAAGADSAVSVYDQISEVVPVVIVNSVTGTWESVLEQLGEVTGHETEAKKAIESYEDKVQEVADSISTPEQPVNIISFGQGGNTLNVWTAESAQGKLLSQLGWEIAVPAEEFANGDPRFAGRKDVKSVAAENFDPALTGKTIFVLNPDGGDSLVDKVKELPQLAGNAAVTADAVHELPPYFFRVDYYSAMKTLEFIQENFKQ